MLMGYASLGSVFAMLDDGEVFAKSCIYMLGTYPVILYNYESSLSYVKPCINHLSRFNTINFLNHVKEINNYDSCIGKLHDAIEEVVNFGINDESASIVTDCMANLDNSNNKIKSIKKKYIGFSL